MKTYQDTLQSVITTGDRKGDRTGTGTISKFGGMMKFSLQHNFWPIPTTRKVSWEKIAEETEWMLRGLINVQWLNDNNNHIWDSWMGDQSGTIGPMYGEQWRNFTTGFTLDDLTRELNAKIHFKETWTADEMSWFIKDMIEQKMKPYEQGGKGGVDQIAYLMNELRNNPDSRRIVVNVWHAGLLPVLADSPKENANKGKMALAPCHPMWQIATANLSDFEILRQVYMNSDEGRDVIEKYSHLNANMDNQALEAFLKGVFNAWLMKNYLVNPAEGRQFSFDIGDDNTLELTAAGCEIINDYKESGKPTRKISLACFARSQDMPLGTTYNVGMYSLLCHIFGALTNMVPWEYTHFMGDHHIYNNQFEGVVEQLLRKPMRPCRVLVNPTMTKVEDFRAKDLQVFYESHPIIKFPPAAV